MFGYFSRLIPSLKENSKAQLRNAAIVPVASSGEKGGVRYIAPSACYLGTSTTYAEIFDYVDFGDEANAFLFHCGARSEPTKLELADRVCNEPARFLSMLQADKYLNLLRTLAADASDLKRDRKLWDKMCKSPFLLAWKTIPTAAKSDDADDDEAGLKHYQLAAPQRVVISNDFISYRIFKDHLLCAPEEESLEHFYTSLGARPLTSLVQTEPRMGSRVVNEEKAARLRKHVIERSKIFLHEYASDKGNIKHDAKWLEKYLTVCIVQSISLRRRLENHNETHTEKRSAARTDSRDGCTLYVTASNDTDMYQVAQAMCPVLLKKHGQQSYIFFEPFLTLGLLGLRARGYNVDRILRAKEAEARIAEEERRKALDEEQKRIREREAKWAQSHNGAVAGGPVDDQKAGSKRQQRDSLPSMPGAFGDDDETPSEPKTNKGKGLFSNLTRRLGLDNGNDEDTAGPAGPAAPTPGPSGPPDGGQQKGHTKGTVTNPALVQANLVNAVRATRPHGSNQLFSQPRVNEVKEQSTYCDSAEAHNLDFVAQASNGMKFFVDKTLVGDAATRFLADNGGLVNAFAGLLTEVGDVYKVMRSALHVFYDVEGRTIAFNRGGSIFFNLRFFIQLHAEGQGARSVGYKREAMVYWWVVMAHELAHNLESTHSAKHSYYT